MKSKEELLDFVETASYEDLLRLWRFEPIGSPYFVPGIYEHVVETMKQKGEELTPVERAQISKDIGWELP